MKNRHPRSESQIDSVRPDFGRDANTSASTEVLTTGSRTRQRVAAGLIVALVAAGLAASSQLGGPAEPDPSIPTIPEAGLDVVEVLEGDLALEARKFRILGQDEAAQATWDKLEALGSDFAFAYQVGNGAVIVDIAKRAVTVISKPDDDNQPPFENDVLIAASNRTIGFKPNNTERFRLYSNVGLVTETQRQSKSVLDIVQSDEVFIYHETVQSLSEVKLAAGSTRVAVPGKGVLVWVPERGTLWLDGFLNDDNQYGHIVSEEQVVAASEAGIVTSVCETDSCVMAFVDWAGVKVRQFDLAPPFVLQSEASTLSPDGNWLTAIRDDTLWFVPTNGGKIFKADVQRNPKITWTPDSSRVAWLEKRGWPFTDFVTVEPGGEPLTVPLELLQAPEPRNAALTFFTPTG